MIQWHVLERYMKRKKDYYPVISQKVCKECWKDCIFHIFTDIHILYSLRTLAN
jgi:hypothetical protein